MTDSETLAALHTLCAQLADEQVECSQKLEQLRRAGKEKSCKFRELLGQKLSNSIVISRLQACGLWQDSAAQG